ncbi:MAG: DUF1045 domain-containing protein [Silicimonas sp.]
MSGFQRYAVYHLPDDAALAAFGASWLGWDVATGTTCGQPPIDGIDELTATPRKYGFHGTLKPPFRLAVGMTAENLGNQVAALAARTAAIRLDSIQLATLSRFLALVPAGDVTALDRLAFKCVTELDAYRAPPTEGEMQKRRTAGLTLRQEAHLSQWGYPYVGDEFRFHLTLTGKLDEPELARMGDAVAAILPALPRPFEIGSISLVGEGKDGEFKQIHRYALTG